MGLGVSFLLVFLQVAWKFLTVLLLTCSTNDLLAQSTNINKLTGLSNSRQWDCSRSRRAPSNDQVHDVEKQVNVDVVVSSSRQIYISSSGGSDCVRLKQSNVDWWVMAPLTRIRAG